MVSHPESKKTYIAILIALLALTLTTVQVARYDLGELSIVAALGIAVVKALLVVLFFMHVRHSPALTKVTVAAGLLWLAILLALTVGDYISRGWLAQPFGWQ